jgi:hypothetical protein
MKLHKSVIIQFNVMVTPNPRYRKPLSGLEAAAQVAKSLEGTLALDLEEKNYRAI